MSVAIRLLERARPVAERTPARPDPYTRSFRAQPRRRVRLRTIVALLLAAGMLFVQVWERTAANALSMERDRLAREVRSLENRIRISRELRESAAWRTGMDLTSLGGLGFENPDPSMVVDIDLSIPGPRTAARPHLPARILGLLRRALPHTWAERVLGLPTAPVEAKGGR
ncbi:MAG: hypothetical protein HY568_02875 [Candidatus Latescibacteria bacterium]|nr:hypothetical protein [Candidatus Latescibacterota bacterium]